MVSIKDDIATCLRMLRARGGALDLKAADFIEAMDSVGARQQTEIQALGKRIAVLEGTLAGAGDPADDIMHDRLAFMVEEAEARLRTAFKGFVYVNPIAELEELVNVAIGELDRLRSLVLFDNQASTMNAEFRGAMYELDEVRITLAKALKTELHDGDTAFLLAHHVAQLVSALRLNQSLHPWCDQRTPEGQRAFLLEGPDPIIKVKGMKA